MLHFPLAKTIVGRSRRLCACFNASLYGTGSPPPVANAVDRVLNKAASKVKIVHPYANKLRQEKLEGQIKLSTAHKTAPRAKLHRPPRPLSQVDDDSLLADITDADRDIERKPLRVEIDQSSSGKWLKDDVSTSGRHALPQRRRASPNAREERSAFMTPSSSQPLSSTSGFKGFGTLPRQPSSASTNALSQSHVPSTSSRTSKTQPTLPSRNSRSNSASRALSASTTAATQRASSSQQHKPNSSVRSVSSRNPAPPALLRLFLFNAEAAQTRELLQQLGLSDRVTVVEDVQSANAIVAAKLARSGKHVKLAQVGSRLQQNYPRDGISKQNLVIADPLPCPLLATG